MIKVQMHGLPGVMLLLALGACSDSADPTDDLQFTISPATAWAGAEVMVRSQAFPDAAGAPVFRIGDSVLAARAKDDSTWVVTLPTTASGPVSMVVALAADTATLDPVTVRGFTGSHEFATNARGNLSVWAKNGDATVLTSDLLNLLEVNATTSTITVYDSLMGSSQFSVSPTPLDNAFVVWPSGATTPEVWSLSPTAQKLATVPESAAPRMTMTLGGDHYVSGFGNGIWLDGGYYEGASEAEAGFMSPTHDRATIRVAWDLNDVPVFDVATGAVAFRLPGIQSTEGVAFSQDGELLAVAGSDSCAECGVSHVQLVKASDGQVLHDTTVASHAWGVAFDRSRPLLYVGVDVVDSAGGAAIRPGVLVLDTDSFAAVGFLSSPATGLTCSFTTQFGVGGSCHGVILVTSDEPAVYAVSGLKANLDSWRFDTE